MGNMRLRYRIPLAVIAIMMVCTLFLGSSYALWKITKQQKGTNLIETGCFELTFTEQSSSIHLTNTYPISDEKGLKTTPYVFTIKNTCTIDAKYTVYLNALDTGNLIPDNLIKYSLKKSTDAVEVANLLTSVPINTDTSAFTYAKPLLTSYTLATGTLRQNESAQYNLRLWIDEKGTVEIGGKQFEAGIASIAYATDATDAE